MCELTLNNGVNPKTAVLEPGNFNSSPSCNIGCYYVRLFMNLHVHLFS